MRAGPSGAPPVTMSEPPPEPTWRRRLFALTAGGLCHGTFLAAVTAMFLGLHDGLASGGLHLTGSTRLALDLLLALQFPLLHSLLLGTRGRAWLARLMGARHGRTLAPTTYAWIAAVQILATFTLWSPSGTVWWAAQGPARLAMNALYAAAWLFLGKALLDGGLGLQTGWIGWTALWRGQRARFPALAQHGLFALCRQPIYLGFALTLWTGPVVTPDRMLLASIWSAYCALGPLHKERRYLRLHGPAFEFYQRRVPYMLPWRGRSAS